MGFGGFVFSTTVYVSFISLLQIVWETVQKHILIYDASKQSYPGRCGTNKICKQTISSYKMGRPSRLTYLAKSAGHPSRQARQCRQARQAEWAEQYGLCGQVS